MASPHLFGHLFIPGISLCREAAVREDIFSCRTPSPPPSGGSLTPVAANARFARARGVNFHPFVPCRSIRANNRPRGQSERRATLICQRWLTVFSASSIARVSERGCRLLGSRFRAVSFRRVAFPDQPLEAEKHTGVGAKEDDEGRERWSKKQTRASQARDQGLATRRGLSRYIHPPACRLPRA